MQQQRLDLSIPPQYDYGDWVRHPGVELACNRLALWLVQGGRLWLRSTSVAGKTHLLRALQQEHPCMGIIQVNRQMTSSSLQQVDAWVRQLESKAFWAADVQAGNLSQSAGHALFHWLERARDMNRPVLVAWRCGSNDFEPPELRTRLNAMEQIETLPPGSDEDLLSVLHSFALSMQWQIPEGSLETLIRYLPRELEIQLEALRWLDEQHAVAGRNRLTKSWIMEQLARSGFGRQSFAAQEDVASTAAVV